MPITDDIPSAQSQPFAAARPTMAHLAQAVGVTKSTVSRAFTRPEMLGADTVARIRDVAARIGYVPNRVARGLSTGRYGNVAVIVPDIANPFFPPLIRAAQLAADGQDVCVFLGNSDEDPAQEDRLVSRFIGQVDGLILVAPRMAEPRIRANAKACPLILINRDVAGIPRLLVDSGPAVSDAVAHLAGLGHRRIVYIGGPPAAWAETERRSAVTAAAARHGLSLAVLALPRPAYEGGRSLVPKILATEATAVVAFDDVTAHGVLSGLAGSGLRIPEDISVVGCDDVLGAQTTPSLTTVATAPRDAGSRAMQMLLDHIGAVGSQDRSVRLPCHLIVRETTGPAATA